MNHLDVKQLRERLFEIALLRIEEEHPDLTRAARRALAREQVRQIVKSVKENVNEARSQPTFEA